MGIKYLNRFIHLYPIPLLEDIAVKDRTIVVDGAELLYHLYFESGEFELDIRSGGEYAALRQNTQKFIEVLNHCGIKCFVVFDSFRSEDNIPRYLQTRSEKLAAIRQSVDEGRTRGARTKPLLGKEVLKQTLLELSVPFVVLPGDADAKLAAIANSLDASVLAGDTDFCIFDLQNGLLPLEDFKWQEALRHRRSSCSGKIFRREVIERTFGTALESIAFLAPLMSNHDGIKEVDFTDFFKSLGREIRVPPHLLRGIRTRFRRPDWIECVLLWLGRYYTNDEETIDLLSSRVPNLPKDKVRQMLDIYNILPDAENYIVALQDGGHEPDANLSCFVHVSGLSVPASFLPIVPDDQNQPSSHVIAATIRKAIYQVGFMKENTAEGNNALGELRVLETDRVGHDYRSNFVSVDADEAPLLPLFVHLESSDVAEREDGIEIKEARKQFLLSTILQTEDLGGLDLLGEELKILAATLKFWGSYGGERRPDEVVKALAFTIAAIDSDMETDNLFGRVSDLVFDKNALHCSTQWQICAMEAMRLNIALDRPLESLQMGKLFSGRLFQKAYQFLVSNNDLSNGDRRAAMFDVDNEYAANFFDRIVNVATSR